MFSSDSISLNEKVNILGSLIACAQSAIASDSISKEDTINVMGVILDYASSIKLAEDVDALTTVAVPSLAIASNIHDRIQFAREKLGLTEDYLARKLNTYSDHTSDWECGITEPTASQIIPLANALKCDPLWLLTGNNTETAK